MSLGACRGIANKASSYTWDIRLSCPWAACAFLPILPITRLRKKVKTRKAKTTCGCLSHLLSSLLLEFELHGMPLFNLSCFLLQLASVS